MAIGVHISISPGSHQAPQGESVPENAITDPLTHEAITDPQTHEPITEPEA